MSRTFPIGCVSLGTVALVASTAGAAWNNAIFDTLADPSTYGTLIDTKDANATYNWPVQGGFTTSGHVNEIGGTEFDRTQVVTDVYRVTTPQVFNDGLNVVNLNPGDRVFAYRIRMVEDSSNTVNAMFEAQITGFGLPGTNTSLATGLLKGRGVFKPDPLVNSPDAQPGDFDDTSGFFGGSVDFFWQGNDAEQLDNNQEIVLLLFSEATAVGFGEANFAGDPGQESGVDPNAVGIPILIPVIPAPASAGLLGLAGLALARRRR